jgi:hypothetical protein
MNKLLACFFFVTVAAYANTVDLGTFTWNGKTYEHATATMTSADKIQILHDSGLFVIPWDDANAALQFKLKPERGTLLAEEAARQSAARAREAARPTPRQVSGNQLTELKTAYRENEIKADSVFRGKRVVVGGSIKDISRDILDRPFLVISDVTLYFSKSEETQIAELKKGQFVTVEGICDGMDFGILSLSKCSLLVN